MVLRGKNVARYKIARDGHTYITQGYEIKDSYKNEIRFCTYQLHPYAEKLLEEASLGEGDKIPREVFYALILEGNIYNDARPKGVSIDAIPSDVLGLAKTMATANRQYFKLFKEQRGYCLDKFRSMRAFFQSNKVHSISKQEILSNVCYLALAVALEKMDY